MNSYQRAGTFIIRCIGFLLVAYTALATLGLVYRVATGTLVPPLSQHIYGAIEYGLAGILCVLFAAPLGRWLGSGLG